MAYIVMYSYCSRSGFLETQPPNDTKNIDFTSYLIPDALSNESRWAFPKAQVPWLWPSQRLGCWLYSYGPPKGSGVGYIVMAFPKAEVEGGSA